MAEFWLSPKAERDLDQIHAHIATDNPNAADHVLETAYATFRKLAQMPGLGRPRRFRHSRLTDLRSKRVGKWDYLIFYRPVPEGIEVARVLHGAQDLEAIFAEEE